MTIFLQPRCVLCRELLHWTTACFTPEFSNDLPNPVERMFTRNSIHWECYRDWSERPAFAQKQFKAHIQQARKNTLTGITYQAEKLRCGFACLGKYGGKQSYTPFSRSRNIFQDDDDALVCIFVADHEPKYLDLYLCATGSKVFVLIDEWLEWIVNIACAGEKLHPFEREALMAILPKLARELPNVPAILARTDWEGTERKWYQ